MTDLPDSAADGAANPSTPDGETPAGDAELAALVGAADAGRGRTSRRGDARATPKLAALVAAAKTVDAPRRGPTSRPTPP